MRRSDYQRTRQHQNDATIEESIVENYREARLQYCGWIDCEVPPGFEAEVEAASEQLPSADYRTGAGQERRHLGAGHQT
jgi:hypothetical protein